MEGFAAVYGLFARARNPADSADDPGVRVRGVALVGWWAAIRLIDQAARGAERSALARGPAVPPPRRRPA